MQQLMDGNKCPDPVTAESQPAREREPQASSGAILKYSGILCTDYLDVDRERGAFSNI